MVKGLAWPGGCLRHAGIRAFYIHDDMYAIGNSTEGQAAVGFHQHPASLGQQFLHQRIDRRLLQRFTTGDLDHHLRPLPQPIDYCSHRHRLPRLFPGVTGIAVTTAQIAAREPHKKTGQAGPSRFALDGVKKFSNQQRIDNLSRHSR